MLLVLSRLPNVSNILCLQAMPVLLISFDGKHISVVICDFLDLESFSFQIPSLE